MKILYATDGSSGGLSSAHFLASLLHQEDTHLDLMTVLDPDDYVDGETQEPFFADTKAALDGFAGHVTMITVAGGSTSVIINEILCHADAKQIDLIVVGASGHSAIARFFIGSVAEGVARYARQPVLITRPLLSPLHEAIVGVDGSDCGRLAVDFAVSRFLLPLACTVRLTSVVPQPYFGVVGDPLYPGTPALDEMERASRGARNKAHRDMEALALTLRAAHPNRRIEVEPVEVGHPADELVRVADNRSAGLIVVGSHGLTGMERFLLGSVSEKVLRHAHCSVLIVK